MAVISGVIVWAFLQKAHSCRSLSVVNLSVRMERLENVFFKIVLLKLWTAHLKGFFI